MAEITPPPTRRQDQAQRDRRLLRVHAHWHAKTMASYSADHPVALREAHRLLDLRMRREAILACIHDIERRSGEPPRRGGHGRFAMPSIRASGRHQAQDIEAHKANARVGCHIEKLVRKANERLSA